MPSPSAKPLCGAFVSRGGAVPPPDVCYLLNEGSGAAVWDYVRQRRSGIFTATSGSPRWTGGPDGFALRFNSSSFQYVPLDAAGYLLTSANAQWTIAVAFFSASTVQGDMYGESNDSTGNTLLVLRLNRTAAGRSSLLVRNEATTVLALDSLQDVYNDGGLHWAVGTHDGVTARLYIDGKFQASGTSPGGTMTVNTVNISGTLRNNGLNNPFDGFVSAMMGWHRALSAGEVAAHFAAPYMWFSRRVYPVSSADVSLTFPWPDHPAIGRRQPVAIPY